MNEIISDNGVCRPAIDKVIGSANKQRSWEINSRSSSSSSAAVSRIQSSARTRRFSKGARIGISDERHRHHWQKEEL